MQNKSMLSFVSLVLLSGVFSITVTTAVSNNTFYVTSVETAESDCPGFCLTLNDYAQNSTAIFSEHVENVKLIFLGGTHMLSIRFRLAGLREITITAASSPTIEKSKILLVENGSSIDFQECEHVVIQHIKIMAKHQNTIRAINVDNLVINITMIEGCQLKYHVNKLTITRSTLIQSPLLLTIPLGRGSLTTKHSLFYMSSVHVCIIFIGPSYPRTCSYRLRLTIKVSNCTFKSNETVPMIGARAYMQAIITIENTKILGFYSLYTEARDGGYATVEVANVVTSGHNAFTVVGTRSSLFAKVSDSTFLRDPFNSNSVGTLVFSIRTDNLVAINAQVKNCTFMHSKNRSIFASVLAKTGLDMTLTNCTFTDNNRALHLSLNQFNWAIKKSLLGTQVNVTLDKCVFKNNTGEKALIDIAMSIANRLVFNITITNSKFVRNGKKVISIKRNQDLSYARSNRQTSCYISNTSVLENSVHPLTENAAIVEILYIADVTIENSTFINNRATSVAAYFSDLSITGNVIFRDNKGIKGGAISLYHSFIYFTKFSSAVFEGNSAKVGGAIHTEQLEDDITSRCFYQTDFDFLILFTKESPFTAYFSNNTAQVGGDNIYGGSIKSHCQIISYGWSVESIDFFSNYGNPFSISDNNTTLSSISSNPTRICLCSNHGVPQCSKMSYILSTTQPHYPGEHFFISAVAVGYEFGTVSTLSYSQILQTDTSTEATLGPNQNIQEIKSHRVCSKLEFSIESPTTNVTEIIVLTAISTNIEQYGSEENLATLIGKYRQEDVVPSDLLHTPVYVNVSLEDCPIGFNLSATPPHVCKCHPQLEESGVTRCIIIDHIGWVYRSGTIWVSASFTSNETDGFVVHQYCPYDYCNTTNTSVDLEFPETQCLFDRSGILCGSCQGNLSMVLGSSRCLPCENSFVALFLVFVLAGFLLVFLIKILDLTVAKGTINGLIFYANIVWANKTLLFPNSPQAPLHFLHVFIAWLNLDLGIETCFFDGLDAYWKTWLQFLFPLYIWTITGLMIITSHYSTTASKLFGNNSVPVLATLILLSYAKLLRTIITILGFSVLNYPHGTEVVWSFDGNVPYFGGAHIVVFIVAITALLILWLPYTTVLLTLQWLRIKSHLRPLRWINRWKPFFDAYFGQLKPKHYYWIGLLLLVRVFLLVLYASTSAVVPRLNILAIIIVGIILLGHMTITGYIYKINYLALLENSFLINLIVLAVGTLYQVPGKQNSTLIYVSTGIAFITFLAIVVYHTWYRTKSMYVTFRRRNRNIEQDNPDVPTELRVVARDPHNRMQYREPLLETSKDEN